MAERFPRTLRPLLVDVAALKPYRDNPRRGDLDAIAASLEANGQFRPIVANRGTKKGASVRGEILAGNHTFQAATEVLGWDRIAVTWVNVDDDQARRIVLADNRIGDLAGYDDRQLANLLEATAKGDAGLDGTGFDDGDLTGLLEKLEGAGPPAEFPKLDEQSVSTAYRCPSCGYEWSGLPKPDEPDADGGAAGGDA